MKRVGCDVLTGTVTDAIGKEWMIITGGRCVAECNPMTASWGGIGWLWNKPVAFVFVRPERWTYHLLEEGELMTLSFLGESKEARAIYNLCGSKSGRDMDKVAAAGLHPVDLESGGVGYTESRLTLVGRKLYADDLKPEAFVDETILSAWYGAAKGGMHRMYVVELIDAWTNEE